MMAEKRQEQLVVRQSPKWAERVKRLQKLHHLEYSQVVDSGIPRSVQPLVRSQRSCLEETRLCLLV
jgi:hypothetical protein